MSEAYVRGSGWGSNTWNFTRCAAETRPARVTGLLPIGTDIKHGATLLQSETQALEEFLPGLLGVAPCGARMRPKSADPLEAIPLPRGRIRAIRERAPCVVR